MRTTIDIDDELLKAAKKTCHRPWHDTQGAR
ncbi:MAG: type II toxin-antitoxin system VapB family antitoxin [Dehalococcoidia bacterium]